MSEYWRLEGHMPVACSATEWSTWFENAGEVRVVARDELPDGHTVSTVFLGIDHNFGDTGPPILFETMVFRPAYQKPPMSEQELAEYREMVRADPPRKWLEGGEVVSDDVDCDRCSTWDQAEAMHARLLRKWRLATTELKVVNGNGGG